LLAPAVLFHDEQTRRFHTLVGRETVFASEAFAAPAYDGFIVTRVDDARLALAACWAEQGACGLVGIGTPISWGSDEYKARPAVRANSRLLRCPDFEHLGSTNRTLAFGCRSTVLHCYLDCVFDFTLCLAFHAIRFSCHGRPIFPGSTFFLVFPKKLMA
jgi:hypothetical protein